MKITNVQIKPAFEQIRTIENFIDKGLPFLVHLHISDALQHFLSDSEKLRLINYDNIKITDLKSYIEKRNLEGSDQKRNGSGKTQMMHKRLESIMNFLITKQKGCIRFVYGKDWTPDMPEELVEYMDKGYSLSLDSNYNHL